MDAVDLFFWGVMLICIISFVLIVASIVFLAQSAGGGVLEKYDERQKSVRGRAYMHTCVILASLILIYSFGAAYFDFHIFNMFIDCCVIVEIAATYFYLKCIFCDAFFGVHKNKKDIKNNIKSMICADAALLLLVLVEIFQGSYIDYIAAGAFVLTISFAVLISAILISCGIKHLQEKREEG